MTPKRFVLVSYDRQERCFAVYGTDSRVENLREMAQDFANEEGVPPVEVFGVLDLEDFEGRFDRVVGALEMD